MPVNADPYSQYFIVFGLAALEKEVFETVAFLEADGTPAQAALVRQAYERFLTQMRKIASVIAEKAEKEILAAEARTRVRPDTGGAGGPRLSTNLGKSSPVPELEGTVAINYEPDLVDWWWTNEEGYHGFVDEGRELKGVFMPGNSAPQSSAFRQHALFRPLGRGPKGIITNPIPARRFVETGAARAQAEWHTMVRAAKARLVADIARAMTATGRRNRPVKP